MLSAFKIYHFFASMPGVIVILIASIVCAFQGHFMVNSFLFSISGFLFGIGIFLGLIRFGAWLDRKI